MQVALPVHKTGRTKFTAQAASDLGRYTGSLPVVHRNQNSFDEMAVMGLESRFYGPVDAELRGIGSDDRQRKIAGKTLPQFFAQVGHIFKAGSMFEPEPLPDLFGTEFFFINGGEIRRQLL